MIWRFVELRCIIVGFVYIYVGVYARCARVCVIQSTFSAFYKMNIDSTKQWKIQWDFVEHAQALKNFSKHFLFSFLLLARCVRGCSSIRFANEIFFFFFRNFFFLLSIEGIEPLSIRRAGRIEETWTLAAASRGNRPFDYDLTKNKKHNPLSLSLARSNNNNNKRSVMKYALRECLRRGRPLVSRQKSSHHIPKKKNARLLPETSLSLCPHTKTSVECELRESR